MGVLEKFVNYGYKKSLHPTLTLEEIRNNNKHRIKGPKKLICNAPFKHIYINNLGNLSACCMTKYDNYGNISEGDIHAIWNGEKIKQFREKIINYNLNNGCQSCNNAIKNKNYSALLASVYDDFLPVRRHSFPSEMTFELSNVCNLECVMCNGEFSSLIRQNRENLPPIKSPFTPSFFQQLNSYFENLSKANFLGGEPFLINDYYIIWQKIYNINPNCNVTIQSNGSVLNNKVKKVLELNNLTLSISLDSLQKSTYEYIRRNASYEKFMDNLHYFIKWMNNKNKILNINFCMMLHNWNELPDVILFCNLHRLSLNVIFVEYPLYDSLRSFNDKKLDQIINNLEDSISKINHVSSNFIQIYNDTIQNIIEIKVQNSIRVVNKNNLLERENTEILHEISQFFNKSHKVYFYLQDLYYNPELKKSVLVNLLMELIYMTKDNDFFLESEEIQLKKIIQRVNTIESHMLNYDFL